MAEPRYDPPAAAAPVVRIKAASVPRSSRKTRPRTVEAPAPATRQASVEEQREDYARARAAYDAGERAAGYQWAQQNNIKVARYCRIAAQRTPAFVEGCMNYLAPGRTSGSAKPSEPAGAQSPEQG